LILRWFECDLDLPVIQITLSKGRTVEQKRELVQKITEESTRILKTKSEKIRILIYEVEGENWADAGILGLDMKAH
jgi:4-oxalocrotonate tautomerase